MTRLLSFSLTLTLAIVLAISGCDSGAEDDGEHCGEERVFVPCPVTVIEVLEGDTVEVGTTVHLTARTMTGVPLAEWSWSVLQPEGAATVFTPSALHPDPMFAPTRPGEYLIVLQAADTEGVESCEPARHLLEVRAKTLIGFDSDVLLHEVGLEREERALDANTPALKDSRLLRKGPNAAD